MTSKGAARAEDEAERLALSFVRTVDKFVLWDLNTSGYSICRQVFEETLLPLLSQAEAAEGMAEAVVSLLGHPATIEGTKSFEELPQGLCPRINDLRSALAKWEALKC